jgi:ankyrin repeat protein
MGTTASVVRRAESPHGTMVEQEGAGAAPALAQSSDSADASRPHSILHTLQAAAIDTFGSLARPGAFAQPDHTLDSLLGTRDALRAALGSLETEIEHRFRDGVGTLPAEAQSLCDGVFGGDDEHRKRLIQATAEYVVRAAPYAHVSKLVKGNVRRVLGLGHTFTTNLVWAGAWDDLQSGIRAHMQKLGRPLERMFRELHLAHHLGGYDPQVPADSAAFAAEDLVQLVPAACAAEHFSGNDVVAHDDMECAYIHFVRMLALALDGAFQKHVDAAFEDAGVHLVGEGVSSGGIKGYERMRNKMLAPEDHGRLSRPRPAHNIDVVRCLATFHTVDDMLKGFDVVRHHVFSSGYTRFKNGMVWDDAEAESRFHLRVVLGTGRFAVRGRPTMGELRADPDVRRLWGGYLEGQKIPGSVARGTWKRHVQTALQWLDDLPDAQEVSMLCEVQMLLREYTAARTAMHELYKIARADTPQRLQADFDRFRVAREAEAAHHRAGDDEVKLACRNGAIDALKQILGGSPRNTAGKGDEVVAALAVASEYAQPRCVKHILQSGALLTPSQLGAALQFAVPAAGALASASLASDEPRAAVAKLLVKAKADVNHARTDDGATAAFMAASHGHVGVLQVLAKAKADVGKARANDGITPAWMAASAGHTDVLQVLAQANADFDQGRANSGSTPLAVAAQNGHADALQVLVQAKADVDKGRTDIDSTPVFVAALNGHANALQVLVQAKADVDKAISNGATPAFEAASYGHADALRVLVQAKADLDKANAAGATPVISAARNGRASALELLLLGKADVTKCMRDTGWSALHVAAGGGHLAVVQLLMDRAPQMRLLGTTAEHQFDKQSFGAGSTATDVARRFKHDNILRVLML